MITLITGLPGHGKTLYALYLMQKMLIDSAARPIYVRGVRGCKLDVIEFDGTSWPQCPDGSICVIDEAQQVFEQRRSGAAPDHVRALETHRHRGIDLVLITQDPSLLDGNVRKLIDRHIHVFRLAGTQNAMVYVWAECESDPRSSGAKARAESHVWGYPRELYGQYDSAVLHTAKVRVPRKVYVLVGALICSGIAGWLATRFLYGRAHGETGLEQYAAAVAPGVRGAAAGGPQDRQQGPMSKEQWLARMTPRIDYRPESAPIYDRQLESFAPPRLYCILVEAAGCSCYTEQATRYVGISESACEQIARGGLYRYERRS